ncbi:hypothetical protein BC829DRAFT_380795 [Chytridium lagenaria]|nr:hypothetical protein BC829DRAFT_380795 [Chytridium lagenaria]
MLSRRFFRHAACVWRKPKAVETFSACRAFSNVTGGETAPARTPLKDAGRDDRLLIVSMKKAIELSDTRIALQSYNSLRERNSLTKLTAKDSASLILLLASQKTSTAKQAETLRTIFMDTSAIHGSQNIRFPEPVFRSLLQLFLRVKDFKTFDVVYNALRESGQAISRDTLNVIMGSYAKRKNLDGVLMIFNEFERLSLISESEDTDASTLISHGPNEVTYLHLINGYIAAGRLEDAKGVLDELRGDAAPVEPTLAIFNSMIHAFALDGQFEQAMLLFQDMQTYGYRPNVFTYNNLMDAYAKAGMEADALRTLRIMIKDFKSGPSRFHVAPTVVSLNILVNMYARIGAPEEAEKIIAAMSGQMEGSPHVVEPNNVTLTALMNAYRKAGDMPGCEETMKRFSANNMSPDVASFNVLILGYLESKNSEAAVGALQRLKQAGVKPNRKTYALLMASADLPTFADLYKDMKMSGVSPNAEILSLALEAVLNYLSSTRSNPHTLLDSLSIYLKELKSFEIISRDISGKVLSILLALSAKPNKLQDAYDEYFSKLILPPGATTLQGLLDERVWETRESLGDSKYNEETANFLLKVYGDLASHGVSLTSEDQERFSSRIQSLLGAKTEALLGSNIKK